MDKLDTTPDIAFYRYTFHFFLLAILIAIIYSNTLVQEWHFDDYPNIVQSKEIHWKKITFETIKETIFRTEGYERSNVSRPLSRLTFAFNYYMSGLNTLSYHLTNVIIHILTSFFIYLVFQKTLIILKSRKEIPFTLITCQDVALLGAVLWAIHPLQTQAVAYIVQRMASMAAMFYIMGMYFYIQGRLEHGELKKIVFFFGFFCCWVLAVFSKENAILLPLSIIIYELIFFDLTKKKVIYIVSLFILFIIAAVSVLIFTRGYDGGSIYEMYSALEGKILKLYAHRPFTMIERLLTEPRILVWYLFLVICPIADFLSLESDIVVSTGFFKPKTTLTSILFILILLSVAVYKHKKIKIVSYAILFFFVNHIVESTFIGLELYFEHRNYLSSIFIYLAISYGLIWLYKFYKDKNKILMHYIIALFIVALLISEGNATYLRNDVWNTEETLHLDSLSKAPNNIRPRISISSYYMKKGKFDEALAHLKDAENIVNSEAVRVQNSWIGLLYHNFGSLYYRKNEFDNSKANLLKSLDYDKYSWETHLLLGMLFFMEGDFDQSVKAYTNAVNLHPTDAKLFNMFGRSLYASGDLNIALEAFRRGIELAEERQMHDMVKIMKFNMIACYLDMGDLNNAMLTFRNIEEYFDQIFYKYNFSFEDDLITLKNKVLYGDIIYLIYKSILYHDNNIQFIEKIVDNIVSSGNEYCVFINDFKENKKLGIIYPSISGIEKDVSRLYYDKMKKFIEDIEYRMAGSKNCFSSKSNIVQN